MFRKCVSTAVSAVAFSTVAGVLAATVSPASAADLSRYEGSLKDTEPVYAPAPIWTGFYVGAHLGYTWADWDGPFAYDDVDNFPDITFDNSSQSLSGDDWLGGLQFGANHQIGRWVLGAEVDVSWTGADDSTSFVPYPTGLDSDNTGEPIWDVRAEMEMFGTARARVGYLTRDDLLLYLTGGLAWAEVESDISVLFPDPTFETPFENARGSVDETHLGYTIGGGLEWMVADNWTLKGEYLYFDLEDEDYAYVGRTAAGNRYGTDRYGPDLDGHILRVGVNYLFRGREERMEPLK
ncbi:outer membrane protein [Dichotomicrobium thermohalophilum]|uniref:Outer membrane immunogenic protein n=1 Tax=Dichotomicrobium thermohalophilum TaxID=933063 RepID=A0A397QEC3_9HYPH|nr:outer membrane protein [Dichotomicrobium thermohalophilum]RIA56424.1 outer membrane immunogenic protein [Dichotomicrobium thermohalophilum]